MVSRTVILAVSLTGLSLAGCSGAADESASATDTNSAIVSYYSEISATEAADLITNSPDLVVIDVRTPEEFAQGHIEGAINVNLQAENFVEELTKLDRADGYLLHCKSGARSAKALEVMKEQDFKSVAHMADGFDGWQAAGLEVAQ